MKKFLWLAFSTGLFAADLQAQHTLMLIKRRGHRAYYFQEGERLKLKLKDSGEVVKGRWYYDREDTLVLDGQLISLRQIDWVDVRNKEAGIFLFRKGQDLLILAGIFYFSSSQINALIREGKLEGDRQVLSVSAGLVAGGLFCALLNQTFRKRKIAVGNRFGIHLK